VGGGKFQPGKPTNSTRVSADTCPLSRGTHAIMSRVVASLVCRCYSQPQCSLCYCYPCLPELPFYPSSPYRMKSRTWLRMLMFQCVLTRIYTTSLIGTQVILGVMSRCPDAITCETVFDKVLERVGDKVDMSLAFIGT
jgi:hypothetical protein